MTVTTRRSSRAAPYSASERPQARQKRAPAGFSWPQEGQTTIRTAYDWPAKESPSACRFGPIPRDRQARSRGERLVDDAISLGESKQGGELFVIGVGLQLEANPNRPEADWYIPVDAEGPSKIEISLRQDGTRM